MIEAAGVPETRHRPWRDVLTVAGVLACGALVTVYIGSCLTGGYPKPWPQRAFDREAWKLSGMKNSSDYDKRGRMIDSLVRDHLRLGMTREEVEDVLGRPNGLWSEDLPHPYYYIASGDGFHSDMGSLALVYDERDTLVGWWTPWTRAGTGLPAFPKC